MKNLWRVIFLFVLPGIVAGGCTVNAFFRLVDSDIELLKIISWAAVLWIFSAWLAMMCCYRVKNLSAIYYPLAALMAIGFSLIVGWGRVGGWAGLGEGVIASVVSGCAAGCIAQAFCSPVYRIHERLYFFSGIILAAALWITAAVKLRLNWMETFFFYACELLLISWLLASPLTGRGSVKRRWLWRAALAAAAVGAYMVTPVFSFRSWNPPPAEMPESLWVKTSITPQGTRFMRMDPDGTTALFTPGGRLIMSDKTDSDMFPALLGTAALAGRNNPRVRISAPGMSHLPQMIKKLQGRLIHHYRMPESMQFGRTRLNQAAFGSGGLGLHSERRLQEVDIFFITALPENPYFVVLRSFLQKNCQAMHKNSVLAIRADLMKNPAVFAFLHDRFKFCTVLPVAGSVWLFADFPVSLPPQSFEEKLDKFTAGLDNDSFYLPSGLWQVFFSGLPNTGAGDLLHQTAEVVSWGNESCIAQLWFYLFCALLYIIWRLLRLLGERRNIMFSCWNSAEGGFSAMGVFLLCMGLLITNWGIFALFCAMLTLVLALSLFRFSCGGVWGGLLGILLLLPAVFGYSWGVLLLLPVMMQAAFGLGRIGYIDSFSVQQNQILLSWTWHGMLLASLFMVAVWCFSIPLPAVCALFFAARLPGIWQSSNKRVY